MEFVIRLPISFLLIDANSPEPALCLWALNPKYIGNHLSIHYEFGQT
jgi:hypothetical protein